jgi:transposase
VDRDATHIVEVLTEDVLRQPPLVEQAMGRRMLALLRQLDAAITSAQDLAEATTQYFTKHPDAEIILSFPGLGPLLGARILAEIGDDPTRFSDPRALKAYAGSAPVTRASGRSRTVSHRRVKNQRLAAAGYLWIFSSLRASAGYRAHYDRRRATGENFAAAQRNLFNKALGQLHHCLTTRQPYDENQAFPTLPAAA